MAQTIARIIGWKGEFTFDQTKPNGMPRKVMDVSRLAELDWTAQPIFETGMLETYRWYVENIAEKGALTA